MRSFGEIWAPTATGLLVPSGHLSESAGRARMTFVHAKSSAIELEHLYAESGLPISPSCPLAKLIDNAKRLSDGWLLNEWDGLTRINAMYSCHLQRIAEAMLPLATVARRGRYLEHLTSSELDFFKRGASAAKDVLWELELWSLLRDAGAPAELRDPPDIVVPIDYAVLGIACKKVYSEKNVAKVLSEAVEQVEGEFDVGVVAVNLDELTPADHVLKVRTERDMARMLQARCDEFVRQHERHLHKYLSTRRLIAAMVSIHVVAEVEEWNSSFNNCRQSTVWNIPGLAERKQALVRHFERMILDIPHGSVASAASQGDARPS